VDIPDIVKITIAGGFVVATAIVGAVIAGPTSDTEFAGRAPISDAPAQDLSLADWRVPEEAFDPLLSTADSFGFPIPLETGWVTLSDSLDMVRPARAFPGGATD